MPSGRFSFASLRMMLKKMENNVGARTHPCLTPFEMGKLSDRDPLCFTCTLMTYMELAEDGETFGRTARKHYNFVVTTAVLVR